MQRRYVHGDHVDEPLVQYNSNAIGVSNWRYLHADHQGSIIAQSDVNGVVLNTLSYDAFGIPASNNVGRFGYTGQIAFKELGLFYYKARVYHPKLGRFLQTDPIGYADSMNMYAYAGNDPINKIDPSGLAGKGVCANSTADACYDYTGSNEDSNGRRSNAATVTPIDGFKPYAEAMGAVMQEGLELYTAAMSLALPEVGGMARVRTAVASAGVKIEKTAALTWTKLENSRKIAVNAFMTQFGKGAPGAQKLAAHIAEKGVPTGLDKEAFSVYRSTIQTIGGNKPITSASEVFNTRLEILDKILLVP